MHKSIYPLLFFLFTASPVLLAQTPSDAIMMEDGQACLAVIYSHDAWSEYWEGTLLRENGNIGTLTRQTVMPMIALGIGSRVNVIAALPWTKTEASAGYVKGVSGLQDWGFWIKGKALDVPAGAGALTFHATAGITNPTSDYLSDYSPFNLGLGCMDFSLRGILQYTLNSGLYLRGHAAYQMRGDAKIERDYYYTTHGIYSDRVDMPNAMQYGLNLGSYFMNDALKVELVFDGLNTFGGFDIRRQEPGFPSNKMIFTRIGGAAQFYAGQSGLSFIASAGQVLSGRNVGKSTQFSAGVAYQFGLWNRTEKEPALN